MQKNTTTLLGAGHLGGVYPFCSRPTPQRFLRIGAKYRYHGPTPMFGGVHDNAETLPNTRDHYTPGPTQSRLYVALCDKKAGKRTYPPTAALAADLPCAGGAECGADTLGAVKIVDGVGVWGFYAYVEPPCVRLGLAALIHKAAAG